MFAFLSLQNQVSSRALAGLSSHFKNVDKKLADAILNEIIDGGPLIEFTDIGKNKI